MGLSDFGVFFFFKDGGHGGERRGKNVISRAVERFNIRNVHNIIPFALRLNAY